MIEFDPQILDRIDAGLALLPRPMTSDRALVMLYSTGLQESLMRDRRQLVGNPPKPKGPARSLWQMERGGGVKGVIEHPASRFWMHQICTRQGVPFTTYALWMQIERDDALAAIAARLLLFTDPKPLPSTDDEEGAWRLYLRVWRPGAYTRGNARKRAELRAKWAKNHPQARQILMERAES